MEMIEYVLEATKQYVEKMPKKQRKEYGQFFTSKETAEFMAELFSVPEKTHLTILDPGSGSGILSAAIIQRLEKIPSVKEIDLVCYEIDQNILGLLASNLEWMQKHSVKKINYRILAENYIISQISDYNSMLDADPNPEKYDIIIGNPPYRKIAKDAPEALAMPDVCYGAPNMYFLFASMSLFNLKDFGEMVYIMPRSWTSGAYFKHFRQKFLSDGALIHIHLFVSRDKVFESESVLQEVLIIKVSKTKVKPERVRITTAQTNADFDERTMFEVPYSTVVSGDDVYVYLVTNQEDAETLELVRQWKNTLPDIGLRMKTGLTVDFRNREALRDEKEECAVPLFYSQHIRNGEVTFPVGREHEYIVTKQNSLLQANKNYLFVKRFTAKEEHRRLQCGIYLAKNYPEYQKISTQNKINYICGSQELSEPTVFGLYVLFNSTLYDCYYRILNGSTQVNATEINAMPVPSLQVIELMGKELISKRDMSEASCNHILRSYL